MFFYVLLIIGLAVVAAVVGFSLRKRQVARRGETLRQAQQERTNEGLSPQPMPETLERLVRKLGTPRLTGLFRGIRVTVYEELAFEQALSKEGVAARITKAFGGQEVTIGDAERRKAVLAAIVPVAAAFSG